MFNKYYENELYKLREQATEFAKKHPLTAPLLMGPTMDPGAERMLEGVAFLTGMLNQKLDNEFQKLVKDTIELIYPHFVRPIPSTSIVLFEPKIGQTSPVKVKAKTTLTSNKIDGTACNFQTAFDIEVQPIKTIATKLTRIKEGNANLEVQLELVGTNLAKWNPKDGLYFFLGGTYTRAAFIYMLLYNNLHKITLRAEDGSEFTLTTDNLAPIGMDINNNLLDFPTQTFSAFHLIQEYFILPHKLFFSKLSGLAKWINRGDSNRFSIIFELQNVNHELPPVNNDTLIFNTVPVINLFNYEMHPIYLDHLTEKVLLQPNPQNTSHYQIYDIQSLYGYKTGSGEKKEYLPIASRINHNSGHAIYQVIRDKSLVNNTPQVHLFFPYQDKLENLHPETLVTTVKCTNGRLPEKLKVGDICKHSFDTPESVTFKNILQPTYSVEPPNNAINYWKFISSLSLNFLSLANIDNLKSLLGLFIATEDHDRPRLIANQKRIDGIHAIKILPINKVFRGRIVSGQSIEIEVIEEQFAGIGDIYIFGTMLSSFFAAYASINTFTQFMIKELNSGVYFKWPIKIGSRHLI